MSRGYALVLAVIAAGVLLSLGVFLVKIVYNGEATVNLLVQREKAYWLAKAGSAVARNRIAENPGWWGEDVGVLGDGRYRVNRAPGAAKYDSTGYQGKAVYPLEGEIR
jgi:hypothetical protein